MSPEEQLLQLSSDLLAAIDQGDWDGYCDLCADDLSAFEPEAVGQLVVGMPFHQFYFDRDGSTLRRQSTITSPQVRLVGDSAAVITYVRVVQSESPSGQMVSRGFEETRIWESQNGTWKHVHFHRSTYEDAGR